ncbi:hypothetical protein BD626DRAFT_566363 [Schizophyllum amplum]|uniref:Actin-like ATPase domain-containing protein n=1 Tax=Schizophyllum amplum TaxID=97359 RepID=A0A550CLQ9_9AGAR|nr:hypothetical protein BD626DRAFT_566363 [Auriculariopsis ampla]
MSQLEAYTGDARKLFISFDIGTTYSGISYCIALPGRPSEIKAVTRFPGQAQIGGNAKIPTVIFYDGDGNVKAIGADTLSDSNIEAAEVEGWTKAEWFKLHLAPNHPGSPTSNQSLPPLPPYKDVLDVLVDFLRYLYSCVRTFIEETHPAGDKLWKSLEDTSDFVLTHPNGWGGAQQADMRAAAVEAGLVPGDKAHDRIHFLTEGEASLHFCGHHGLVLDSMQDGNGVILVDAGGGTIDLSAYATNGKTSGGTFSEIAASKCVFQGSIFVTRRAEEYFSSTFKNSKWEGDVAYMAQVFDKQTKLTIKGAADAAVVKFGNFKDTDPDLNVRNGQLKIPGNIAVGFFQPSIDAVYKAVLEQMALVQGRGKRVTSVYIVGGFGASPLLFGDLKASLDRLDIAVCRPDTHVNKAVADGGVLHLLKGRVTTRMSRYTYGIIVKCKIPYLASKPGHRKREHTAFKDVKGEKCIPNSFAIILPANVQISHDEEFRCPFASVTEQPPDAAFVHYVSLYAYRGTKHDPEWMDEEKDKFSVLCVIQADTRLNERAVFIQDHEPGGSPHWRLVFDVVLLFGLTELKAQVAWKDYRGKEQR